MLGALSVAHADLRAESGTLQVFWNVSGNQKALKTWKVSELSALKQVESREQDPLSGESKRWSGVSLTEIFDAATVGLNPNERATMDTIVLLSERGGFSKRADIPRSFITRFTVILATKVDGNPVGGRGPLYSIVPWSSQKGVFDEKLPLQTYFVPDVTTIVLTNSKNLYGSRLFLSQRGDPVRLRGQKRFVQACMGCHRWQDLPSGNALTQAVDSHDLFSALHATVRGVPSFDELDQYGLKQYVRAISGGKPTQTTSSDSGSTGMTSLWNRITAK